MQIKVKSEQCFAVTSAKRVPVFQTTLKLENRQVPNSPTITTNTQHLKDQNIYDKNAVNKNALI